MSGKRSSTQVAWVPLCIGSVLWIGATALLLEDAYRAGHITVQHALMPALTSSTVCAAVMAHHRFATWKIPAGLAFSLLAVLGSVLTVWGTIGRTAEAHDFKVAVARNTNGQTAERAAELKTAKEARDKECKSIGKKCEAWNARVDQLQKQMVGMVTTAEDGKLDATVNFLGLMTGADESWLRKLLNALEPILLPGFLELGSIVFFAAAFPVHAATVASHLPSDPYGNSSVPLATVATLEAIVTPSFTRDEALADFRRLGFSGSQHFLSDRWGVHPATVSKWFAVWEAAGLISRERNGKSKATLMLPAPSPEPRRRLGHMAKGEGLYNAG